MLKVNQKFYYFLAPVRSTNYFNFTKQLNFLIMSCLVFFEKKALYMNQIPV